MRTQATRPAVRPEPVSGSSGAKAADRSRQAPALNPDLPPKSPHTPGASHPKAARSGAKSQLEARQKKTKEPPAELTPQTHPQRFTAAGELKWAVPPPGVTVIPNHTGRGDWIEKWQSPTTGKWVHNYTAAKRAEKVGQKFADNAAMAQKLPALRQAYREAFDRPGKEGVIALAVALIDQAYFRVGNEDSADHGRIAVTYSRDGGAAHVEPAPPTFGTTTLEKDHVRVRGDRVTFSFLGKSRVEQNKLVVDPVIARGLKALLAACDAPTDRLFRWAGKSIDAADVNAYLRPFGITAKQFRTYHANRLAHTFLRQADPSAPSEREAIVEAMYKSVAKELGHEWTTCRDHYVDPTLVRAFLRGRL